MPGLGIPGQNQVRDRTIYTFVSLNGSSLLEPGAKGAYNGSSGIHDTFFFLSLLTLLTCVYLSQKQTAFAMTLPDFELEYVTLNTLIIIPLRTQNFSVSH